jgi:hypothetical protein
MKTPLVLLLALSLAGNAVLAVMSLRSASSSSATAASVAAASATPTGKGATTAAAAVASPAIEITPAVWQALKPNGNLKGLIANLRAAGFPPAVIRAVATQMISEQVGSVGLEHLPFWKQNSNNPEYLAAQQQLGARKRELYNDLLGDDARPSAALDPAARERRYGQLSDDKIDKIENLNRDINDLRTKLYAERKGTDIQSVMSTQAAAEQEQRAELAAILTPTELEQYEMRSSSAANRVMSNVKGIDVTEDEYAALFRAQKAYEAADPVRTGGALNQDSMIARANAQDQLNEQARAALSDDRFYEYLKGADPSYARTAQFTANYPDVTPAMTYQVAQIDRAYQTAMMSLARSTNLTGNTPPSAERMGQLMSARKDYQDKLASVLGADVATAYTQRNRGGIVTTTSVARPSGP